MQTLSSKCDLFYSYQEKGSGGLVIETLHFKVRTQIRFSQGTKIPHTLGQLSPWGETKEKTVTHNKRKKIPHATTKIPHSQK